MDLDKTSLLIFGLILCVVLISVLYSSESYMHTMCMNIADMQRLKDKKRLGEIQTAPLYSGGNESVNGGKSKKRFFPGGTLERGDTPLSQHDLDVAHTRFPPERMF